MQMLFEEDGKTIKLSPQNLSPKWRVYKWGIVLENDMPKSDVNQASNRPETAAAALENNAELDA
jgi:hypothetical protein